MSIIFLETETTGLENLSCELVTMQLMTPSGRTITGTGGSNGEIFILEDVKLDLRSAIYQHPSFTSFPSFPCFTHVTNNYTNAVKEGKEAKTDIECASRLCFTSEVGETRERREIREISKIPETEEIQIVNSSVVSEEECIRILKEEGF
jgi:hypothetical protein